MPASFVTSWNCTPNGFRFSLPLPSGVFCVFVGVLGVCCPFVTSARKPQRTSSTHAALHPVLAAVRFFRLALIAFLNAIIAGNNWPKHAVSRQRALRPFSLNFLPQAAVPLTLLLS